MEAVTLLCAMPMYGSEDAAILTDLRDYCAENGLNLLVVSLQGGNGGLQLTINDSGEPGAFERLRSYIEWRYKELML